MKRENTLLLSNVKLNVEIMSNREKKHTFFLQHIFAKKKHSKLQSSFCCKYINLCCLMYGQTK